MLEKMKSREMNAEKDFYIGTLLSLTIKKLNDIVKNNTDEVVIKEKCREVLDNFLSNYLYVALDKKLVNKSEREER